jgi:hypothetical protein
MFDIALGQNDTVGQNVTVWEKRNVKKMRYTSQRGQIVKVSERGRSETDGKNVMEGT